MLKRTLAIGLSILLASQSLISGSYAIDQGTAETISSEITVTVEDSKMTNMEAMKILVQYFGVDYFTKSVDENLADNQTKEKIHKMLTEPNRAMTNFDMVNLLSDLVDVKERQLIESKSTETESNVNLNSNLMTFFELGYLNDAKSFSPSNEASVKGMKSVLDNMLGYVVKSEEDLKNIPKGVKRVTIVNSGITVENMTIEADVFVTPKAKNGVTFKNSEIKGTLEVSGGTEKSPVVLEGTSVEHVVLSQSSFETTMKINGGSKVQSVKSKMNSNIICEDDSTIDTLETEAKTKVVVGKGVRIEEMITEGVTELETEKGAKITTLKAKANTKITGTDVVEKLEKESKDVKIDDSSKKTAVTPAKNTGKVSGGGGGGGGSSKKKSDSSDDNSTNTDNGNDSDNSGENGNEGNDSDGKHLVAPIRYVEIDSNKVSVTFYDVFGKLDEDSAENESNYIIEGLGHPDSAVLSEFDVILTYESLVEDQMYTLVVSNVKSSDGKYTNESSIDFINHSAPSFDKAHIDQVSNIHNGILRVEFSNYLDINNPKTTLTYRAVNNHEITGTVKSVYYGETAKSVLFDVSSLEGTGLEYEIIDISDIKNTMDQDVVLEDIGFTFVTSADYTEEKSRLSCVKAEQSDYRSIQVNYAYLLELTGSSVIIKNQNGDSAQFKVIVWQNSVTLEYDQEGPAPFKNGDLLIVNLSESVKDRIGRFVKSEKLEIEWNGFEKGPSTKVQSIHVGWSSLHIRFYNDYGPIDRVSAQEELNYYIEGIGYPSSANIANDYDNEVVLDFSKTSNRFKEGKYYELEVYNIGNSKNILNRVSPIEFIYNSDVLDDERPKVVSIQNVNNGILMVEFSEEMHYDKEEGAKLEYVNVSTPDKTLYLSAYNYAGEECESIVFDISSLESSSERFEIVGFSNITDRAGNSVDSFDVDMTFETSGTYNLEDNKLVYKSAEQVDDITIKITYDQEVYLDVGAWEFGDSDGNKYEFIVNYDMNTVLLSYFVDEEYLLETGDIITFDLSDIVTDVIGRPVKSEIIEVEWEHVDLESPHIEYVEAISTHEVLVKYNESVLEEGTYIVTNSEGVEFSDYLISSGNKMNEVIIQLNEDTPLNSDNVYYLEQNKFAEDFSKNTAKETEKIEFVGSDYSFKFEEIYGVQLLGATMIEIQNDDKLPNGQYSVTSGASITGDLMVQFDLNDGDIRNVNNGDGYNPSYKCVDNGILIEFSDKNALVDSQEYILSMDVVQPNEYGDQTHRFNGRAQLLDIEFASSIIIKSNDLDIGYVIDDETLLYLSINGVEVQMSPSDVDDDTIRCDLNVGDEVRILVKNSNGQLHAISNLFIIK